MFNGIFNYSAVFPLVLLELLRRLICFNLFLRRSTYTCVCVHVHIHGNIFKYLITLCGECLLKALICYHPYLHIHRQVKIFGLVFMASKLLTYTVKKKSIYYRSTEISKIVILKLGECLSAFLYRYS